MNTPVREPAGKTSDLVFVNADGTTQQKLLVNLHPTYKIDWGGWGPRLAVDYRASNQLLFHAAGSITTIVPNLFQTNSTIAGAPFILTPYLSAAPGSPIQFENTVSHFELPVIYTPSGQPVFATGRSSDVPSGNTSGRAAVRERPRGSDSRPSDSFTYDIRY